MSTLFEEILSRVKRPTQGAGELYTSFCPAHETDGNEHSPSVDFRREADERARLAS